MDLIICFCILFIGILLLWECSKILLIKTVESIANIGLSPPTKIANIKYSPTETTPIQLQLKINELIEAFNDSIDFGYSPLIKIVNIKQQKRRIILMIQMILKNQIKLKNQINTPIYR